MAMDRQSEWIILRRVLAFLKSRKLHRAAYALEKEARLKLDLPHLHDLFAKGRWRAADEYVTAFMSGKESTTPSASATLFVVRFERFVRALRRGHEAWAMRYFRRAIRPLMSSHPDEAAARAECNRAMLDRHSLHTNYPDDAAYREQRLIHFYRCVYQNEHISRSFNDIFDTNLRFMRATTAIGLRRHAHRPRRRTPTPAA
uniref:Uncharacterized protein n=1 Tax=Hordeum vulgare subsp. vulgare TaxID=112509 RepID=A0A8I7BEY6_HORVV